MPQPLRVVDNERLHARDAARNAVKKFRLDRERERLPICNQSTGARNLFTDEVLKRTEREMPVIQRRQSIFKPYAIFLALILLAVFGTLLLVAKVAK